MLENKCICIIYTLRTAVKNDIQENTRLFCKNGRIKMRFCAECCIE